MRTIAFLSDFGRRDVYAGVVEARIAAIAPTARVIHLSHDVPPQDLEHGGYCLFASAPHLPDETIVLAVVDPGVGTARRAVVARTARLTWVVPDNGLAGAAWLADPPRAAIELSIPDGAPSTFHGRDVFGPAAARLAAGAALDALGAPIDPTSLRAAAIAPRAGPDGQVWTHDHYGNVITTLFAPSSASHVEIAGASAPFVRTYADVAPGALLALVGSSGLVEVSVRDGSAIARLGLPTSTSIPVAVR